MTGEPTLGSPSVRWTVGCGAELRRRLLWRDVPAGNEVACTRLPDGTAIAVCSDRNCSLQAWDLATGTPHGPPLSWPDAGWRGPWREVACIQLPDGTPVAVTGGSDGVLRMWDLLAGQLRWEAPTDKVYSLALAAGTAVTGSEAGTIRFWDVATGRPRDRTVRCDHRLPRVACTELADGTPVAVIGDGESLRVWDLAAGGFQNEPMAVDFDVYQLACLRLRDGTSLAIVGSDRLRDEETSQRYGAVQAWDLASGRPYGRPLKDHSGEINDLAATLLADGTPIAVAVDRYGSVRAWNLASSLAHGPPLPAIGDSPALACATLPDGTPVVVTADEDIQVWSLLVEPSPQGLIGPIWTVGCVELPDGDEVVVTAGHEDRHGYTIQLWQADTGRPRGRLLAGHADDALACTRLRDGTPVVLTPDGDGVRLWNVSGDSRDVQLAGHSGELDVLDCLTRHDGTPILITGGGPVRAWEVDSGQPYGPPLPVTPNWRRALSSLELTDGTLLVIVLDEHENLRAWEPRTGQPHGQPLASRADKVDAVAGTLLRDGTPAAVTAGDGTLRVWHLATNASHGPPRHLRMSRPWALACTRLPDGTALAAVGGSDEPEGTGVVEIWDLGQRQPPHVIRVPETVMGLTFTAGHRLVVRTYLDITVYDLP